MKIEEIWKSQDMIKYIEEFYKVYLKRPIKDNNGGMKSPHLFACWYILKKIQPKFIIESGVWKGLGTWFFEDASPKSKIFSIDPNPQFRVYTSKNVTYFTEDFSNINFNEILNVEETLVFFDDHQNSIDRVNQCLFYGLKKIIFEDNYPYDQGDCYSLKKVLSGKDYLIDINGQKKYYKNNPDDKKFIESKINRYQELPPIFKSEKTRWGNDWDYDTPDALLDIEIDNYDEFKKEILDYTWICYLEL